MSILIHIKIFKIMISQEYRQTKEFLESLGNIPDPVSFLGRGTRSASRRDKRKFFILRLRFLLNLIDNPDRYLKFVHITGTSGKTSTTFFTVGILRAAGFKVGAFVSPHTISMTERIHLGDKLISPAELVEIVAYLKPFLTLCAETSPYGCPSFFEIMLCIAIIYFKNKKCDYAVLEAGIGGMFDATNVIKKSAVEIITNVGLDHTDVLGDTCAAIARDKAGIIKTGGRFFTAEANPAIRKIFQNICHAKRVPFRHINGDYRIIKSDLSGVDFEYEGKRFKTKLVGEHQAGNAVLAFEAVKKIIKGDLGAFRRGIANVFVPCRLEEMPKIKGKRKALVILDGAHNVDKMKTTAEFIRKFEYNKLHLIIGLSKNKDADGILKEIIPLADKVYLTRFLHHGRKTQYLGRMSQIARRSTKGEVAVFIDPNDALAAAEKAAGKDDLILATGSFFLVGSLRGRWFPEEYILEKRKMI
jgi:dihydrofolate synthase / folylpolyglutamate synthase